MRTQVFPESPRLPKLAVDPILCFVCGLPTHCGWTACRVTQAKSHVVIQQAVEKKLELGREL